MILKARGNKKSQIFEVKQSEGGTRPVTTILKGGESVEIPAYNYYSVKNLQSKESILVSDSHITAN